MKIMKKLITLSMLFLATALFAQEEEGSKVSISGSVDTYYQTVLSASDQTVQPNGGYAFGTSFADETGFALGMANLIASYDGEKTGVVADVVFGPRGDAAIGGYNLNQLYAYWNVSESTTLTLGRWNTYLGYEVISPTGNFNYSTSYMFSSGPFSMVGLKADFAFSDDFSLMLAVMNPTDYNNNFIGGYSFGAQLGFYGQYLNLYYDDNEVLGFEVDYTGGFDVTDSFFLGINAAYQTMEVDDVTGGFYGVALYPQLGLSDSFDLGLRGELFGYHEEDADDLPSVLSLTLTGSYSIENLTIKPEFRIDSWGNDFEPYLDNDLMPTNSLSSILLAAIYSF